jgi:hypothetical protein
MSKALRVIRTPSSLRGFQRDPVEGVIWEITDLAGLDWWVMTTAVMAWLPGERGLRRR